MTTEKNKKILFLSLVSRTRVCARESLFFFLSFLYYFLLISFLVLFSLSTFFFFFSLLIVQICTFLYNYTPFLYIYRHNCAIIPHFCTFIPNNCTFIPNNCTFMYRFKQLRYPIIIRCNHTKYPNMFPICRSLRILTFKTCSLFVADIL